MIETFVLTGFLLKIDDKIQVQFTRNLLHYLNNSKLIVLFLRNLITVDNQVLFIVDNSCNKKYHPQQGS